MALGRKVYAGVKFITEGDSALDKSASDYLKYVEDGYDWKHIKLLPGVKPTVFHLRQLTHRQRIARDSIDAVAQRLTYTVRCGLERVENYLIEKPDGSTVELHQPEFENSRDEGKMIVEKWMDEANFPLEHTIMIAATIQKISEAQLPLSKGCASHSGAGGTDEKKAETAPS